jgi:catechol 2,3-dioxygenase-like lactoylglutathione lyase family enzyme
MASPTTVESQSRESASGLPTSVHHVSVPVKDVQQAMRFFTSVLGAEFFQDLGAFAEVTLGGTIIGFSKQSGGWTAPDAEFPHYAFRVEAENLWPLKARLEEAGVRTHPIWTRNGYTGLMYFRDPTGNLWELYCPRVNEEDESKMVRRGENGFAPPIDQLSYEWNG